MSKFYIPSTSASAISTPAYEPSIPSEAEDDDNDDYDDDDDLDTLPYPGELTRADFLVPSFDPQAYLSTLRNRHQTLEDLRADLRQRSQLLNQELLDLVNGNYEEFLGLGGDLRGGEEKVEGVRVGLLGFQREIESIKNTVAQRAAEVRTLLGERKAIRRDVVRGRNVLEVGERVRELERRLGIAVRTGEEGDEESLDDEDDEDEDEENDEEEEGSAGANASVPIRRLRGVAQQYSLIVMLVQRLGPDQPYLQALDSRLNDVRKTILLDLAAALRKARDAKDTVAILAIMDIFESLHAEAESIRVLQGS